MARGLHILMATSRHPIMIVLVATATVAGLVHAWLAFEMRQATYVRAAYVLATAAVATWLWVVVLAPTPRQARLFVAVLPLVAGALALCLLRIEGVDGNLLPELRWRWTRHDVQWLEPAPDLRTTGDATYDYPQFLGPERNGHANGPVLARTWEAQPRLVWRRDVGEGWSAFAVAGNRAVTQEQHGEEEVVACYELATGAPQWTYRDRTRFASTVAGNGPRSTPTIQGNRVVTMGATGILNCLDLATGTRHWSVDVLLDNDGTNQDWGTAGSPLAWDDRVIVNPAGTADHSLVAYAMEDGRRLWTSGGDTASYSSPARAMLGGREQVVIVNAGSVSGHEPDSGSVLWRVPWPGKQPKVAQPVLLPGSRLFIAASYGVGCALLHIVTDAEGIQSGTIVWSNRNLKAKFTNPVYHEGHLYGLDEGILVCLDMITGHRAWKAGRYGHGQLLCADGLLIVQCEDGTVALAAASPDTHVERGRFTALNARTWNSPALAGHYLLVRNHREAACFELPGAAP